MALLAALSEDGTHHQRGGCASSSVVGSSGQSSSNGRTHEHSHPDHILPNCPEYSSLARVVRVRYDDTVVVVTWLPSAPSMPLL